MEWYVYLSSGPNDDDGVEQNNDDTKEPDDEDTPCSYNKTHYEGIDVYWSS